MNFGTWYLAATAGGDVEAVGTLHPVGACDLHRRLSSGTGQPAVVLDAGDFENGLTDFAMFFDVLAHVRNVGGHVVVVDGKGPMSQFLGGMGLADPVVVAPSLARAWESLGALAAPMGASPPPMPVAASGRRP